MDANQPSHYMIEVYKKSPFVEEPTKTTLCPGARHLSRPLLVLKPSEVTCRRCGELMDVIGLREITKKAGPSAGPSD